MNLRVDVIGGKYHEVSIDDHETSTGTMDDKKAVKFAKHLIEVAEEILCNTGNDKEEDILTDLVNQLEIITDN